MTHPNPAPRYCFAVIGGDLRMTYLSRRLCEEGHAVRVLGCGQDCLPLREAIRPPRLCSTLQAAADGAHALILPLPVSRDGSSIHCPRDPSCRIPLSEIGELLQREPRLLLYGGRIPEALTTLTADPRVTDYYEDETLQLRNAYITAEAALMTAMEMTDTVLSGTQAAVLGYGRIGKRLSRLLRAVGAEVTVCARRVESLWEAASEGCRTLLIDPSAPMQGLSPLCGRTEILFNTVPAPILTRELLSGLGEHVLLLDLASSPFGVTDTDAKEAAEQGWIRYLRAPSLPGSYAPREAGHAIAECILRDLSVRSLAPKAEPLAKEGGSTP